MRESKTNVAYERAVAELTLALDCSGSCDIAAHITAAIGGLKQGLGQCAGVSIERYAVTWRCGLMQCGNVRI